MISLAFGQPGMVSEAGGGEALRIVRSHCLYGPVLRLHGRLDRATAPLLARSLARDASTGAAGVILNVDGLERMDADGLVALADVTAGWQRRGRHPLLVSGCSPVAEQIHRSGLADRVLTTVTEAAALEVLHSILGETAEPSRADARLARVKAAGLT